MLTLPWFPPDLKPNARVYRLKKAIAAKQYRQACYLLAKGHAPMQGHLRIVFYPPNRRLMDLDNCLASIKFGLDGVADAWGINDRLFRPLTIDFGDRIGGYVEISEVVI